MGGQPQRISRRDEEGGFKVKVGQPKAQIMNL